MKELLHKEVEHSYLNLKNPTVIKAFTVAKELTAWVLYYAVSQYPVVHVEMGMGYLQLSIGEICVFNSETDSEEDTLSYEACKKLYLQEIHNLMEPFTAEKEQESIKEDEQ